jgi:pimeloyl-ACP methyl ester carboxylesterase
MSADPATTPEETREDWRARLADIGQKEGFFEDIGDQHSALFVRRGDTLVVTFDNLDHVYERGEDRMPWGFGYTTSRGWSVLGLMAHDWTWYRDEAVHDFFDRLRDDGFFDKFKRVVFYGASMGAYAAAVFSAAAPGATVICISPQATLDRDVTSWETRYHKAWKRDYNSRYGYAPNMIAQANKAYLFYDPTAPLDAMHAALFQSDNIVRMKCRFMGHRIASLWANMGVLKPVIEGCIEGTLTQTQFYRLMRARHTTPRYQHEMLDRLKAQNRHALLVRYCKHILSVRRGPKFRREMQNSRRILERQK